MKKLIILLLMCTTITVSAQYGQYKPKHNLIIDDAHWTDYTILYTGIMSTFVVVTYVNSGISTGQYTVQDMNKVAVTCIASTFLTYHVNKIIREQCQKKKHKPKKFKCYY